VDAFAVASPRLPSRHGSKVSMLSMDPWQARKEAAPPMARQSSGSSQLSMIGTTKVSFDLDSPDARHGVALVKLHTNDRALHRSKSKSGALELHEVEHEVDSPRDATRRGTKSSPNHRNASKKSTRGGSKEAIMLEPSKHANEVAEAVQQLAAGLQALEELVDEEEEAEEASGSAAKPAMPAMPVAAERPRKAKPPPPRPTDLLKLAKALSIPFPILKQSADVFREHCLRPKHQEHDAHFDALRDGRIPLVQYVKAFGPRMDPDDRPPGCANQESTVDFKEFVYWFYSRGFSEDAVLTSEQRGDRADAREMGVDYVDMENYKRTFNKFDTDGSGEIEFEEFEHLIYKLTRVPEGIELPPGRVEQLWREACRDGSGCIQFKDFVTFYSMYFADSDGTSRSPFEDFYSQIRKTAL